MDKRIIEDQPELYEKLKPYIEYLEGLGFRTCKKDMKYFSPHNEDNYGYFNGWSYKGYNEQDWVVDLASYTYEPKIEVYTYKIVKTPKNYYIREGGKHYPFIITNESNDGIYDSKIVTDLESFKKEIGKYLKVVKTYREKVKKYEMEKDFT